MGFFNGKKEVERKKRLRKSSKQKIGAELREGQKSKILVAFLFSGSKAFMKSLAEKGRDGVCLFHCY